MSRCSSGAHHASGDDAIVAAMNDRQESECLALVPRTLRLRRADARGDAVRMTAAVALLGAVALGGAVPAAVARIARNPAVRAAFHRTHPCPATGRGAGRCPGYVVDHVVPLTRGGADALWNLQWQTQAAARAKDRWE
jgi:5-methylcytosine-specific restriction endonuclease McrA